jgi:hypothetical protein
MNMNSIERKLVFPHIPVDTYNACHSDEVRIGLRHPSIASFLHKLQHITIIIFFSRQAHTLIIHCNEQSKDMLLNSFVYNNSSYIALYILFSQGLRNSVFLVCLTI